MSPKCLRDPELAGVGIEYSWGKSKQHFRRHTDHVGKHLHDNIVKCMSEEVLPLARVRKCARKSRSYRRAYGGEGGMMSHENIEKMVKIQKRHRGADRQDAGWLARN